jgi:hypothetical protein
MLMKSKIDWPSWCGLSLISVTLVLFLYSFLSPSYILDSIALQPFKTVLPGSGQIVTICENCSLIVRRPVTLRPGGSGTVGLEMQFGDLAAGSMGQINPKEYHLVAESRLEVPGMQVLPPDLTSRGLPDSGNLSFFWELNPHQEGNFQGNLWLFLNLVPANGDELERLPVLARSIDIHVASILGMQINLARWVGAGGIIIGLLTILASKFLASLHKPE